MPKYTVELTLTIGSTEVIQAKDIDDLEKEIEETIRYGICPIGCELLDWEHEIKDYEDY